MRGAKKRHLHLYNSTSPAQRKHVFQWRRAPRSSPIATRGTSWVKQYFAAAHRRRPRRCASNIRRRVFNEHGIGFSLEICEAVTDIWQPTVADKIILNLPATVEYATPNVPPTRSSGMCTI